MSTAEAFPFPAASDLPARREARRLDGGTLVVSALAFTLAALIFAAHYALELRLARLETFNQFDVLFDTDPILRLVGFSHGWNPYNRNLLHPNLANLINPPVRFIARTLQMIWFGDVALPVLRETLALMVNPVFSALQGLATLGLFLRLGLSRPAAFLFALLGACSFSQIIFGSIPDHFALSGFLLTVTLLLAADLLRRQGTINWPAWLFTGWLVGSITISNLAVFGLVFLIALRVCRRPAAFRQTAVLVGAAAVLTFASALLLNLGYDAEPQPSGKAVKWSFAFLRPDPVATLLRFPTAVADTIAPPEADVTNIRYLRPQNARYAIQFTLAETPSIVSRANWLGTAVFLLVIGGAIGHFRAGGHRRALLWCSLAVLGFNALFHAAWGHEYFLYSQHWLIAVLFLAAGIFPGQPRPAPATFALVAVTTATVALNNYLNLQLILSTLANYP